jgi:hypothetical protein
LDAQQKFLGTCGDNAVPPNCTPGDPSQEVEVGELLYQLTREKGSVTDEALVVLMSFYVGESQEETDAVIARGRRMLPYLRKYQHSIPVIPNRKYSGALIKKRSTRIEDFEGAIRAIKRGWHSTADSPEG